MTDSDQEPDLFTQALRLDLPSTADEARVRAKLVSAGVLAGASVVVPGAAAAATTGGGFVAKLAALPLALKIGASVVAVSAAALPVVASVASSTDTLPAPRAAETARVAPAPAGADETAVSAAAPRAEPAPAAPEVLASPVAAAPVRPRENASASADASPAAVAVLPAVGAFPAAEAAPVDEGTLRAETALMERALAAIKQGDLVTARRELALHATKFPNGHLKPERERALERTLGKETER
jgi:hypothetical protein